MRLPKVILTEIGYNLQISDLASLRLTCKHINLSFRRDYFWYRRLILDFNYCPITDNCLDLYSKLYTGSLVICQNKLMSIKDYIYCGGLVSNGMVVLFWRPHTNYQPHQIYYDIWNRDYEYWNNKLQFGCGIRAVLDKKIRGFFKFSYSTNYCYYIAPNQMRNWMTKFKLGERYECDVFENYLELAW